MGAADVELAAKPAPITASAASVTVFMTYLLLGKAIRNDFAQTAATDS